MRLLSCASRSTLALLVAGGAACGDAGSESPLDPVASTTFELTPLQDSGFAAALEDARVRLLPALQDLDHTGRVGAALEDLSLALSTRHASRLRQALSGAEDALAALPDSEENAAAVAVELDAVRLLLAEARQVAESSSR